MENFYNFITNNISLMLISILYAMAMKIHAEIIKRNTIRDLNACYKIKMMELKVLKQIKENERKNKNGNSPG